MRRGPAAAAAASPDQQAAASDDDALQERLRQQMCSVFPTSLLVSSDPLPCLATSRHFINLTNGLELVPLLQRAQLPFSFVRIRSTSLEQQAFESLVLELDANLLLSLALGHSCVVWDAGIRHAASGAPRALWYGLEFIRFVLHRAWGCGHTTTSATDKSNSSSSSSSSGGEGGGDEQQQQAAAMAAHIRGHNVSRDFEAAVRSFAPTTRTRLRYYRRYVTPEVQRSGVRLVGAYMRTTHDEDTPFFVGLAQQLCGPAAAAGAAAGDGAACGALQPADTGADQEQHGAAAQPQRPHGVLPGCPLAASSRGSSVCAPPDIQQGSCACVRLYQQLVEAQVGLLGRGLSHTEFKLLQAQSQ